MQFYHVCGCPAQYYTTDLLILSSLNCNCTAFVWDPSKCHPNVHLSNENCTASVGDNAHWICAGGSRVLESGRHYWELQLDRYGIPSPNKKIVAGIVHATGLDPRCWQRNRSIIGLYYSPFNTQSWSLALQTGRKLSQSTRSRFVHMLHSACIHSRHAWASQCDFKMVFSGVVWYL